MKPELIEIIKKLPKNDLHVHLDGSVRLETLIDLSKKQQLSLPSYTVEGLNELVFKERYANLGEYLQGFNCVLPVMQISENLERIAYEFAIDNINENVCYVEVRFAPQLHMNNKQTLEQVLLSVNNGLNRAKLEYQNKINFNYSIIICVMRNGDPISNSELIKESIKIKNNHNIPVVAIDLAGPEHGYPPVLHKQAYSVAHKHLLYATVHAGEACGIESIYQALAELYPDRIGHGYALFASQRSTHIDINTMINYMAQKRITIEVCLSSNLQTIPNLNNEIINHPLSKMLDNKLSVAICTDNRTVSKTSVTQELIKAAQNFNLDQKGIEKIIFNGFKKSFYPGSYLEKIAYIEQVKQKFTSFNN